MYSAIATNKRRSILIMFLFVILIIGLSWAVGLYFGNQNYVIFGLIYALVYAIISYFVADKAAILTSGAKEIKKNDNVRLWRIVENLCITTGQPMPKVYIIQDKAMNAFATGRKPEISHIAFTSGIVAGLEDSELQAVAAHELGHIQNYDIRLMMVVLACVTAISIISQFALRMMWWGGDDSESNSPVLMIVGIVLIILIPIVGIFVQMAVSRKRELLADATSAMTTRYPEGLISALQKIGTQGSVLKKSNTATAHMYFSNPIKKGMFSKLISTHPPIEQRIAALQKMETSL